MEEEESNIQVTEEKEKKEKKYDPQGRKWQFTINDPVPKGLTHEEIKKRLFTLKGIDYLCMSDEVGDRHHTHVYAHFERPKRFSTMKNLISQAHIERAIGTSTQNREYIFKQGKWEDTKKKETNLADTHEEWGELPVERPGARNDLAELYEMIQDGMSNYEILEENPDFITQIERIDRVRQTIQEEIFKDTFRNLETVYIFGDTGAGKTRGVMEQYGYTNVYRVTNYKNPFDNYRGQDVIMFEEFAGSLPIMQMLIYLDGYPVMLPCRYTDKVACFTKVYIISNLDLKAQYPDIQKHAPETWQAFLRRIHKVQTYQNGNVTEYALFDYLYGFHMLTAEQLMLHPFAEQSEG